jgi:hypothetical protein
MLHAGLDLSRTRLDFDLRDADGALVEAGATLDRSAVAGRRLALWDATPWSPSLRPRATG